MDSRAEKVAKMHAEVAHLRSQLSELQNPNVGDAVDERVQTYIRDHAGTSYSDALTAVLRANPDLAKEFNESFTASTTT